MVSNEDWHAAHEIVCDIRDASARYPDDADSGDIVDALVKAGWGPRPTVSAAKLDEYIADAVTGRAASASAAMRGFLRECRIEVTP